MTAIDSNQFWDLVGGVFRLSLEAFQEIASLERGILPSVLVVLFAGLSLGIGQSIILFINRVKPVRFVFSLLLNAVLFTFGFLFLAFSTWLICLLPGSVDVSFRTLIKVFGFSYAPQLFSFLGALPYAGLPILNVLSVWRLLAAVVGFEAAAALAAFKKNPPPRRFSLGTLPMGWLRSCENRSLMNCDLRLSITRSIAKTRMV